MFGLKFAAKIIVCCHLGILLQKSIKYVHFVFFRALEIFGINNKTTIEFGFCTMYDMKNYADFGEYYPPKPKAGADNTLLDLQNSSYHTQPLIVNY